MDVNTLWYLKAYLLFVLFNVSALVSVLIFHKKQWRIDLTQYRHYTSLIFQICGIIYALFLSFIVWDVWERYYDVKRMIQDEATYIVDLYRDSTNFGDQGDQIRTEIEEYVYHVIKSEWRHMEAPGALRKGDQLINGIWRTYYDFTPTTEKETIWYSESIRKLNELTNARLTRIFNNSNSVGLLRWILLIGGGLFLVSMPCFFKVDLLFFKIFLAFFLANIIAFMLFIIFSLDHPFTGYVEIHSTAFNYTLETIQSWK
ncbi:MAG: hypothetical protein WAM28_05340 [Chlamydiales bacterium]